MLGSVVGASALVVGSLGAGGAGAAGGTANGGVATVTMERDGQELFFDGPGTVAPGDTLKVKNLTNPATIGPHTFSLVRKADLPATRNQLKNCGKELRRICGEIIEWHEVDLDTGKVGVNPVDVGEEGFDQEGSLNRKGDSWVAERKNQTFRREITAQDGETVHFICAIHPDMQGKFKVEG